MDASKTTPIVNLIGGYEPQDAAKTLPVWQKSASMGMVYFAWQKSSYKPWHKPNHLTEYWQTTFLEPTSQKTDRGLSVTSGIDGIVSTAEFSAAEMDTEPGTIEVFESVFEAPLDLHIDADVLDDWSLTLLVTGGYEPYEDEGFITVWQDLNKDTEKSDDEVHSIYIEWDEDDDHPSASESTTVWTAEFHLAGGDFYLESNRYPETTWGEVKGDALTLGKEVWLFWHTFWSGCAEPEQDFAIMSIRDTPLIPYVDNPR